MKTSLLERIKSSDPESLATQLAIEIDKLEQEKIRDPLTGAFNRGFIGAVLGQEIALAHKNNGNLGFIMLDIDHFKSINDQEPDGHGAGDRVLVAIKKLMKKICGKHSLVGRWGGEEFALVIPDVTPEGLLEIVEDIGRTIDGWLAKDAQLVRSQVTASMGVVLAEAEEAPVDMIQRADKLLYEAKESGRARAVVDTGEKKIVVKFT